MITLAEYAVKVGIVRDLQRLEENHASDPIYQQARHESESELDALTASILAPPIVPDPDDPEDFGVEFP